MKIEVIQCPKCKDKIFSRTRHDLRYCTCKKLAVDGGHMDNNIWIGERVLGNIDFDKLKSEIISLDVTEQDLYIDWDYSVDGFGIIKPKKK